MLLVRLGANIHIIFYKCKNFPSYFKEIWEITLFEDSVGSERGVFSGHGNHDDENKSKADAHHPHQVIEHIHVFIQVYLVGPTVLAVATQLYAIRSEKCLTMHSSVIPHPA